jgi:hypothetical protein
LFSTFSDPEIAAYEFAYIPAFVGTNGNVAYDADTDNMNEGMPSDATPSIFWDDSIDELRI